MYLLVVFAAINPPEGQVVAEWDLARQRLVSCTLTPCSAMATLANGPHSRDVSVSVPIAPQQWATIEATLTPS